jgi:hypothetical protein
MLEYIASVNLLSCNFILMAITLLNVAYLPYASAIMQLHSPLK